MELRGPNAAYLATSSKWTDLGEIPLDWAVKNLRDICSIRVGGDVERDHLSPHESSEYPHPIWANARSPMPYGYSSTSYCPGKSVTVTARGEIGYAVYRDRPYCPVGRLLSLVPTTNISARFIAEFINTRLSFAVESTGVPQLTAPQIGGYSIAVPPDSYETHRIAGALSDADALIDSLEQLLTKKRQIKQGAMQELLTGKRRLPGFNGEWVPRSMADLFDVSGGLSASRDQLGDIGPCYLHYGDIHLSIKTYIDLDAEHHEMPHLDVDLRKVSTSTQLKNGDVVFVDASEDDQGVSKHVVIHSQGSRSLISGLHTIVAKPKTDELVDLYKRYCFQTPAVHAQFRFYAAGTKVSGVSKGNIGKIVLNVPSPAEQVEIAACLSELDTELTALESRLTKARALKQAMAQALLTGRIRLVKEGVAA